MKGRDIVMKSGLMIVAIGAVIGAMIAITTNVTWQMAGVGIACFLFSQIAIDESRTLKGAEHKNGHTFSGVAILLCGVCLGTGNWWIMLHYGVPALIGLVIPVTIARLVETITATAKQAITQP